MERFNLEKEKIAIEKLNKEADAHIAEGRELNIKAKAAAEKVKILFGL